MIAEKNYIIQRTWSKIIFWLAGAAGTVFLTKELISQPEQTLIIAIILIALFVASRNKQLGLYIIIFLPVVGEMLRLSIGPANELLISDIFIPLFVSVWIFTKIFKEKSTLITKQPRLLIPFILFIIIGGLSLIQATVFLNPREILSGSLYLIRFVQYGLLYFVTLDTITNHKQITNTIKVIAISAVFLAIAGFIQLKIYPNLSDLVEKGWDPHINRLVSTWLDPNFIGGLFAFIISILLGIALYTKKVEHKMGILGIVVMLALALFLTYSRSAYLALGTGVLIISLLKSRKIFIIMLAIFIIGIGISPRAQQRVGELTQSITSIVNTESALTPDPTAKLRIQSWEQSIQLIKKRPLLGSGYNTLRTVMHKEGFIKDPQVHSGSGSDSSLLTILSTTGILGLIPFIFLYIYSLITAFKNWRKNEKKTSNKTDSLTTIKGYSFGLIGGIFALLVHSIFVNSLLFPQILIYFWICIGINESIYRCIDP
jgi:putative inorganic carbon (HCO3(-)) transporter